jgi:hypothetical protein
MSQVKVDRLHIRVKGRSPRLVRTAIAGLGHQIQTQIDRQGGLRKPPGRHHLDRIHLDPIQIGRETTSTELSARIASLVVKAITMHSIDR